MPRVQYVRNSNIDTVLKERYLDKDEKGNYNETPEQMIDRVAKCVASAENTDEKKTYWTEEFYNLIASQQFMPNSPTLMNAGRRLGQAAACFVVPIEDSIDGIMKAATATALIQKSGGGTGFTLDRLRPTNDYIKSSGGTTSGPISFWRILHRVTESIQQGSFRRGANMMQMSLFHPDILKFIYVKQDLTEFTSYNISVKITDHEMRIIREAPKTPLLVRNPRNGKEFWIPKTINGPALLTYGINELHEYNKANPPSNTDDFWSYGEVWNVICKNAWHTGEPGLCFIDRVQESNTIAHKVIIETSNPCGEQYLPQWGSCNLGSINLALFIKSDHTVDWDGLKKCVRASVRFLDNIIDVNKAPLPEIKEQALNDRRIGLGIMGFADALFAMRVRFNSEAGFMFAQEVMSFIQREAHQYSSELAEEKGVFPWFEGSTWDKKGIKMRNCMVTNVAPTGTISILADCSGGLEPLFALGFWRNVLGGQRMWQGNKYFDLALTNANISEHDRNEIYKHIAGTGEKGSVGSGTLRNCPVELPQWIKEVFVTARDIPIEDHIRMQSVFQTNIDNACSKTINLLESATPKDVEDAFWLAFNLKCKGVTVYRDNCRKNQPMSLGDSKMATVVPQKPRKRILPKIGKCTSYKFTDNLGDIYVNLRYNPESPSEVYEIFTNLDQRNTILDMYANALSISISLGLRYGVPAEIFEVLEKKIRKMEDDAPLGPFGVTTSPEAIGRALRFYRLGLHDDSAVKKYYAETSMKLEQIKNNFDNLPEEYKKPVGTVCPDCGDVMYPNPGCVSGFLCYSCGHSNGPCKG